jgi:CysZ protein
MREILAGLKTYLRAWRLIWQARLWPLLVIPGLIGMFYFPLVGLLTYWHGGKVARYLQENWLPEFLKRKFIAWLITVTVWLLALYLGFILFRNLVIILYSPVLSYLSQRTEEAVQSGGRGGANPNRMIRGALRGIGVSLTSLGLALVGFVICCLLLLIPVLGQVAMAVLLPASQMFLAGHGFVDPTLERRDLGVKASFRFAWRNRGRVIGCGAGFVLLTLLPVAGWFLGPTLGVVAGTLVTLDKLEETERG